jgi:hypothetical protein
MLPLGVLAKKHALRVWVLKQCAATVVVNAAHYRISERVACGERLDLQDKSSYGGFTDVDMNYFARETIP